MAGLEPASQHRLRLAELPGPEAWGLPHLTPQPQTRLSSLLLPGLGVWPWMSRCAGELSKDRKGSLLPPLHQA